MLSDRARQDWSGFARSLAAPTALNRDRLQRFLVGLHLRGEELPAQDLHWLVEETGLVGADRNALVATIEFGLGLLATYEALEEMDREIYRDEGMSGVEL